MTLLKDLLKIHEDSLKEKSVHDQPADDTMVDIDDKDAPKADAPKSGDDFTISMDESLFMRLMEYAREEVKNDIQLHKMVSAIEELMGSNDRLSMDHYVQIVGEKAAASEEDKKDDEEAKDEAPADDKDSEEEE